MSWLANGRHSHISELLCNSLNLQPHIILITCMMTTCKVYFSNITSSIWATIHATSWASIFMLFKNSKPTSHINPKFGDATLISLHYMYTRLLGHKNSNTAFPPHKSNTPRPYEPTDLPWHRYVINISHNFCVTH